MKLRPLLLTAGLSIALAVGAAPAVAASPPALPTPDQLTMPGASACTGEPTYSSDTTPELRATPRGGPQTLGLSFEVFRATDAPQTPKPVTRVRFTTEPLRAYADTATSWSTDHGPTTNDPTPLTSGRYAWRVRSSTLGADPIRSGWSKFRYFTVETDTPDQPTITSADYPDDWWGSTTFEPGEITLTSDPSTARFVYKLDWPTPTLTTTTCDFTQERFVTATDGTARLRLPRGISTGPHRLYVAAINDARKTSSDSEYSLVVSPDYGSGVGPLDAEGPDVTVTEVRHSPAAPDPRIYERDLKRASFSAGKASHVVASGGTPEEPARVSYTFSVRDRAHYAIGADVGACDHCADLRFQVDGQVVNALDPGDPASTAGTLDSGSGTPLTVRTGHDRPPGAPLPVSFGGLQLAPGQHTVTVELVGPGARTDYVYPAGRITDTPYADHGYTALVDRLRVIQLQGARFDSLGAAYNNNGIGRPKKAAASLQLGSKLGFSRPELRKAGFGPRLATVKGLQFPIAPEGARGIDNVVAAGQTVQLPPGQRGRYLYALVTASCGSIPPSSRVGFTLRFSNMAAPYQSLGHVPDWREAPGPTAALTTSRYLTGTKVTPGRASIHLLQMEIPSDFDGHDLVQVGLPRLGTPLDSGCVTPALHVFSLLVSDQEPTN